ncbi:MAG TPA: retropepsin-like aspartic protease [Terriglobia bacterium]|nr:retropepsin-like aspartic protease [Terriglobia bacterium]
MNIRHGIAAFILLVSTLGSSRAEVDAKTRRVLLEKDGGAIELRVAHWEDIQNREVLRQELQEEAKTGIPSANPAMQQYGKEIEYRYESTPFGGKIHIIARKPEALAAVQEFLHAQLRSPKGALGFDYVGNTGLVVIPVMINKRGPYRFLLDTGASNTIVSKGIADGLKIAGGQNRTIITAGGSIPVTLRSVKILEVGAVRLKDVQIAAGDFNLLKTMNVDGILGSDYLRRFKVSINYDDQIVDIETCCPELMSSLT